MDDRLQNKDGELGADAEFEEAALAEAPTWDMVSLFLLMFAICSLIFILVVLCFLYKRCLGTVWRTSIRALSFHRHSGTTGQSDNPQSFELSPLANQGDSEPGASEDVQLNIPSSVPAPGRTQRISPVGPRNEGNVDAQGNEPRQTSGNEPKQFPHAQSGSGGARQKTQTRETTARSEKVTFHREPERKYRFPSATPTTSSTTSRQPSGHARAPRSASTDSRRELKPRLPPILLEHTFYPRRPQRDPFTSNPNRKEKAAPRPLNETVPIIFLKLLLSDSEDD